MFDIGFSELVLVLIVGLVVLGPQRLPVAIRTVMSWVNTIRSMANNVQNELKQELKLQELQESIKKAEQFDLKSLSPDLSKTVEELKASAEKMKAELDQKAAETGQTIEQQAKQMREAANVASAEINDSLKSEDVSVSALSDVEKISEKDTALEPELSPAEQAELAEMHDESGEIIDTQLDSLHAYYPPEEEMTLSPATPTPVERSHSDSRQTS